MNEREIKFIKFMGAIPWPQFGGIGVHTASKNTSHPRNSGIFFLGAMLRGKKINGKIVFTSEAY